MTDENPHPTFKDLYEVQSKIDTRMGRLEKGMIVLAVLVASPKLGGPSASQLVAVFLQNVA